MVDDSGFEPDPGFLGRLCDSPPAGRYGSRCRDFPESRRSQKAQPRFSHVTIRADRPDGCRRPGPTTGRTAARTLIPGGLGPAGSAVSRHVDAGGVSGYDPDSYTLLPAIDSLAVVLHRLGGRARPVAPGCHSVAGSRCPPLPQIVWRALAAGCIILLPSDAQAQRAGLRGFARYHPLGRLRLYCVIRRHPSPSGPAGRLTVPLRPSPSPRHLNTQFYISHPVGRALAAAIAETSVYGTTPDCAWSGRRCS